MRYASLPRDGIYPKFQISKTHVLPRELQSWLSADLGLSVLADAF